MKARDNRWTLKRDILKAFRWRYVSKLKSLTFKCYFVPFIDMATSFLVLNKSSRGKSFWYLLHIGDVQKAFQTKITNVSQKSPFKVCTMLGDWKEVLKALNLSIKRNKKRQDRAQSAYKFTPNQKRVYYTICGQKY